MKATLIKLNRIRKNQNIKPENPSTKLRAGFWPGARLTLTLLLGGILLCTEAIAASPVAQGGNTKAVSVYAKVGNVVITWQDFSNEYAGEASNKFYHGKPSDAEVAVFQRQVGEKLVTDVLLTQEAKRRKLKPDNAAVEQGLQKYEQRFAKDPKWPEARSRVLPIITKRLQDENIRTQLEALVRNVPPPAIKQVREYYDAHPDKFTSPPQPRVSVILIRVDPSASENDWHKATEEAEGLVKRARAGEDFATLARDYSGDSTAEEGGDMGYLHAGMLPGLPEQVVGKLQPGETADPVKLLEGVAIFRLTDRTQPAKSSFETARQRVSDLLLNEQSDAAWKSLIVKLRKKTSIHVNESRFLPLTAAVEKPAEKPAKPAEKPAENDAAVVPATK